MTDGGAPPRSVHVFRVRAMDGEDVPLSRYEGRVLLLVNTASRCGFTPQYDELEALWKRHAERGLVVLGFPSNDFLGQEPGTDEEILEFCRANHGVTFPLFSKLHVKGPDMHPLFEHLTKESAHAGGVRWNFTKFLTDRRGVVVDRFAPTVSPGDPKVTRAIEAQLDAP